MPLQMVHLAVAKNLTDKLKINDVSGFYLGSISPDAIHMRENFKREYKDISHLKVLNDPDKEIRHKNAKKFIIENSSAETRDFYLGYGVHILTDIYWTKTLYRTLFIARYSEDKTPVQDEVWAYYNDTDQLDFELYKKYQYRPEIWQYLSKSKSIGITGVVSAEEVEAWKERVLHWFESGESQHKNPVKYISYDELLNFTQNAADYIYTDIIADILDICT